jgi:hypothetical protein
MQHTVMAAVLVTEIDLILGQVIGCDQLPREEAGALEAGDVSLADTIRYF